jgi:hypothetical protein
MSKIRSAGRGLGYTLTATIFLTGCNSDSSRSPAPYSTTILSTSLDKSKITNQINVEYKPWYLPVALRPSEDPAVEKIAMDLARAIGNVPVVHVSENPGCCMWIEVTHWHPYPSSTGYIVLIQQGGGIVSASDAKQLRFALDRIARAYKQGSLPQGVLTNYPSVAIGSE